MKEQAKVEVVPCPCGRLGRCGASRIKINGELTEEIYITESEANTKADSLRAAQEREIPAAICTNPRCQYPDITHSVEMMGCIEARATHSKESEPSFKLVEREDLNELRIYERGEIQYLKVAADSELATFIRKLAASPSPVRPACSFCGKPENDELHEEAMLTFSSESSDDYHRFRAAEPAGREYQSCCGALEGESHKVSCASNGVAVTENKEPAAAQPESQEARDWIWKAAQAIYQDAESFIESQGEAAPINPQIRDYKILQMSRRIHEALAAHNGDSK